MRLPIRSLHHGHVEMAAMSKALTCTPGQLQKVYDAVRANDVAAMNELRHHIDPSVLLRRLTPSLSQSDFSLLDVAFYALNPRKEPKDANDLAATDRSVRWLLERGLELGDRDILTRPIFGAKWTPISRAMAMLCHSSTLFLLEQGVSAHPPPYQGDMSYQRGFDGLYAVGSLIEGSRAKGDGPAMMRSMIAAHKRSSAARAALEEIESEFRLKIG